VLRVGFVGLAILLALGSVAGCAAEAEPARVTADEAAGGGSTQAADPSATPSVSAPSAPASSSASSASPADQQADQETEAAPLATAGRPSPARLSIPALGLRGVRVLPYVGTPDDRPGTAIQDGGDLAAPHGSGGLVGPGGIGNFLVTGHRTSSTRPFADLPSLRPGARVVVESGRHRLVYEIVRTRQTSFRRPASLRAQSAAVPGHPGRTPTRAMITLSTCATPEDHAAGNFWSDELHNPEHRIDKIGALRSIRPR